MYNNPYEYFRPQHMNAMESNMMENMADMSYQAPPKTAAQTPFYGQMPTMPMQPIQPMMPMGAIPSTMGIPAAPITAPGTAGPTHMGPMPTTAGIMGVPMAGTAELVPGTTSGAMPTGVASIPLGAIDQFGETPVMDTEYTQGYLRTQIGKRVKVEFLIGTNMLVDREGTLVDVGISYIIINEVETDDLLLCDIYSIKFVRFYF